MRGGWLLVVLLGCYVGCGVMVPTVACGEGLSSVGGVGAPGSLEGSLVVSGVQSLDEDQQAQAAEQARLVNPEAIVARENSRTSFENLDSEQAEKIAGEAFPNVIDREAGGLPLLSAGQRVVGYPADNAAQVELGGGKHGVIESMEPLAVEVSSGQRVPIDLDLSEVGGAFQAVSSVVGVRIPKRLGEGVQVRYWCVVDAGRWGGVAVGWFRRNS